MHGCRRLTLISFLAFAAFAFPQSIDTGELHVHVNDPGGATVIDAAATLQDEQKNTVKTVRRSDSNGEYLFLLIPPGEYKLSISKDGFAASATRLRVTVGQIADVAVTLNVATVSQSVIVSGSQEPLETERSSSTTTIDEDRILNLPINGRNYISFALTDSRIRRDTAPVIGAAPTSGLNFEGQRARSNLVNIDGADAVDASVNGIRSTVSQEGVQEFQIIANGFNPEYGRASGGVINIITRSGGDGFHGSVFAFLRNRKFQAVNRFSTVPDPAYTRIQSGLTVGGPIQRGRTFYFFSFESTRRHETGFSTIGANNFDLVNSDISRFVGGPPGTVVVQATAAQAAFLQQAPITAQTQAYAALVGRASGMAINGRWPAALGGISAFASTCSAPPCGPAPQSFVPLASVVGNYPIFEGTSIYSLRLDHNFSDTQSGTLRVQASPSTLSASDLGQQPQNFGQNAYSRASVTTYRDVSVSAQHNWTMGSTRVNEARFQFARRGLRYGFSNGPGGSNVAVNVFGYAYLGRDPVSTVDRTEQRFQVADNFSLARGSHLFKFGGELQYLPVSANFTLSFGGIYDFGSVNLFPSPFPGFSSVQAYGLGLPQRFTQGVGNPHDSFSNTAVAGFVQDSWRIKRRLTINYGVRYDVELTPKENPPDPVTSAAYNAFRIVQGIPRDYNNFAPRIGAVWDTTGHGKTVVRASYGIFYDHPPLALVFDSDVADGSRAPQLVFAGGTPGGCVLNAPNAFQGLLGCLPPAFNYLAKQQRFNPQPNAPSIFTGQQYLSAGVPLPIEPYLFPNAKNFQYDYSNQASAAIETTLGDKLILDVEYNFNGGRHLYRPIDINAPRSDLLLANWQRALIAGDSGAAQGPLSVGSDFSKPLCGRDPGGDPWVSAALVNFFRPSGMNPSLAPTVQALPGGAACLTLASQIESASGLGRGVPVPFSDLFTNLSNGSSDYNGLTLELRKQVSRYQFLASYTWSHSIDDSTDLVAPLVPQDNYRPNLDRSNSSFDQRHRFVFSGVYHAGKHESGLMGGRLISNWTVAPILEVSSGRPFNILVGEDRNFDFSDTNDRPLVVPAGTPVSACGDAPVGSRFSPTGYLQPPCFLNGTLVGTLGRNAGTRPWTLFNDLRVSRVFGLSERLKLETIADVFNLANRFNVSDVNPLWNKAGIPTAAFDPRQFQFALRMTW